jgi:hypothetical protein
MASRIVATRNRDAELDERHAAPGAALAFTAFTSQQAFATVPPSEFCLK